MTCKPWVRAVAQAEHGQLDASKVVHGQLLAQELGPEGSCVAREVALAGGGEDEAGQVGLGQVFLSHDEWSTDAVP